MITNYVEDVSKWERWMQEYKYGIILIFPPEPHNSKITELRKRYAWSQSSECEAHISLTMQIPRPMNEKHLVEIENRLSEVSVFTVKYGPIIDKPKHPGVVLDISPQDKLRDLINVLESSSLYEGALVRKYPFYGHMTIAEMLTMEQTFAIISELKDMPLEGEFELNYLFYAVPDENFKFTERKRIYLGTKANVERART